MNVRFSEVRWGLILVAGVGTILLVALVIFAVVVAYAASLAVQAQGPPDGARIARFAEAGDWMAPLLIVPVTFGAALWAARKAKTEAKLHGLLVGIIVAATGPILSWPPNPVAVGASLLALGAGWLGGRFGVRTWRKDRERKEVEKEQETLSTEEGGR